tara:strand:- start:16906 stop:17115 length:210 start_codon:yes stop_codon:yes gene_type:complete
MKITELDKARKDYKEKKISFNDLEKIFFTVGRDKEMNAFYNSPVYDRPNVIVGLTQEEMDVQWNEIIKQ